MSAIELVLSLIAPHECLACGEEGTLLCAICAHDAMDTVPDRCHRCLALSRDAAVCRKCKPASSMKYVWVTTEYAGIAKRLVHDFKFERAQAAHQPIAELMAETLPYLAPETVITHVPTATSRHRARGYDQSQLIATKLAELKGVRYLPLFERHGQTRQVGAAKKQRHDQAKGMFRLRKSTLPPKTVVILVDDILTTGSSIEAAAMLLKEAGIKQVSAAVFAQKH